MKYAGIGSRRTPQKILEAMEGLAFDAALEGLTLRTGGAPGADQAFEFGHYHAWQQNAKGVIELYLPWPGFEDHHDEGEDKRVLIYTEPSPEAMTMAAKFHPAWPQLSPGARKLHARNCHQMLGPDLDDPVDFVVCWTPDGSLDGQGGRSGGTGQALRIAAAHAVVVYNLKNADDLHRVKSCLTNDVTP